MKKNKPNAKTEPSVNPLQPRLHEGLFIAIVALCVYFLMALITYDATDPGWSHTGNTGAIQNEAGRSGAWISDALYSLMGYTAFLVPLMLGFRAWILFKDRYHNQVAFDWVVITFRIIGFILVLIGCTGLLSLQGPNVDSSLPFGYGGLLGKNIAEASLAALNVVGSRLVLSAVLLIGMTIFTDLSWLKLMDGLGRYTLMLAQKVKDGMRALGERWERRKQRKEEDKKIQEAQQKRQQITENKRVKVEKKREIKIEPVVPKAQVSDRAEREKQATLFSDEPVVGELPQLSLLDDGENTSDKGFSKEALEAMSRLLEIKLKDFNISAEVVAVYPGPVITRFEVQPAAGIKVSKISGLAKDLARSLAVISVRVVEVIPGKTVIGIEVPNEHREIVFLNQVLTSKTFGDAKSPLTLALGNDISGEPVCADLAKMPHLLVAGTTGSGKSVGVNAMLLSLLFKATPEDVRLLLIDPKMLELSVYEGIPHLLTPVITDMKDAANGLRWCVGEMERRYKLMAAMGVRNVAGFNKKIIEAQKAGEPLLDPLWKPEEEFSAGDEVAPAPELETLPYIVVVIDEFADMMMIVGKKVEELIARIAQKARAAGIHLILATQRPSVDVITGLIKANVPSRIGFQVSSKIDSRTILDQGGAEQLLGHGDMLYLPPGSSIPIRVHGAFVSDDEVHRVAGDWKKRGKPDYIDGLLEEGGSEAIPGIEPMESGDGSDESDPLFDEAVAFVTKARKVSISSVQRQLRIGYNRSARLVEAMEAAGVVSSPAHNGSREVLAPPPPE